MVKLFCAIVGVAGSAFPVAIDAGQTVGDLKEAIKEKKPRTITTDEPDQLQLFLAKKADGEWITEADVAQGVQTTDGLTQLLAARAEIGDVGLSEDDVRVHVSKEEIAALEGPVNVLVVVPDGGGWRFGCGDLEQEEKAHLNKRLDNSVFVREVQGSWQLGEVVEEAQRSDRVPSR